MSGFKHGSILNGNLCLSRGNSQRKSTVTRNYQLAAIRRFFSFVADKGPVYIAQCAEILTVPLKREPTPAPCYFEPEEVEAILAQPDCSTLEGMRDHVVLSFLDNSGARICERVGSGMLAPVEFERQQALTA